MSKPIQRLRSQHCWSRKAMWQNTCTVKPAPPPSTSGEQVVGEKKAPPRFLSPLSSVFKLPEESERTTQIRTLFRLAQRPTSDRPSGAARGPKKESGSMGGEEAC
ncbi:hypothetical protein MTO96_027323 [Rhipicephalus appendiculatus]